MMNMWKCLNQLVFNDFKRSGGRLHSRRLSENRLVNRIESRPIYWLIFWRFWCPKGELSRAEKHDKWGQWKTVDDKTRQDRTRQGSGCQKCRKRGRRTGGGGVYPAIRGRPPRGLRSEVLRVVGLPFSFPNDFLYHLLNQLWIRFLTPFGIDFGQIFDWFWIHFPLPNPCPNRLC